MIKETSIRRPDGEMKAPTRGQVWQTGVVTSGRIIIGRRVGT